MSRTAAFIIVLLWLGTTATAQETPKPAAPASSASKPVLSPTLRLQAAKTVSVKRMEGSTLASDTVSNILEGWGRYTVVNSDKPADLIVEISSPDEGSGGVSISSSSSGMKDGKYEESNKSSREISSGGGTLRVVVRDAKTNTTLFVASEYVKGAMKKNARENNVVSAVEAVMAKFHERVEPANPAK